MEPEQQHAVTWRMYNSLVWTGQIASYVAVVVADRIIIQMRKKTEECTEEEELLNQKLRYLYFVLSLFSLCFLTPAMILAIKLGDVPDIKREVFGVMVLSTYMIFSLSHFSKVY